MLRKVILNLKHFTSWFIKGEKKNPNQTKQPQKPVCYFSITIIQRPRTLGPTKSWNSLKAVPKKLASGALSRTLCFLWTLVKACFGDWCVSPFSGCAPSCGVCIGWIWRSPCGSSCSSETPPGPGAPAPPATWSDDCSGTDTEHRGHQPQPHALKHISFPSETCSPFLIFFKDLNNDFKDPETSWVPSNTISTTLRNLGAPWRKKLTRLLGLYRFPARTWCVSMSSSTLAPGMLSMTWRSRHTPLPFSRLEQTNISEYSGQSELKSSQRGW